MRKRVPRPFSQQYYPITIKSTRACECDIAFGLYRTYVITIVLPVGVAAVLTVSKGDASDFSPHLQTIGHPQCNIFTKQVCINNLYPIHCYEVCKVI